MPESTASNVYELVARGVILGQECINSYFYGGDAPIADLHDLLTAWISEVHNNLTPLVSVQYTVEQVDVIEVKGGNAFAIFPFVDGGLVSGDCCPPTICWDFTLLRGGAGERNGYKRFAGVPESLQLNGVGTSGAIINNNAFAPHLAASLTIVAEVYAPVIRRTKVHKVNKNPPVYYTTASATYAGIGTQNSRKFGHGR